MADKIRIASGASKKIEVNDAGEYIILPLADDSFVVSVYKLLDDIRTGANNIKAPEADDIVGNLEAVDKLVEMERETKLKIDGLFGAETCRKVFGDILPSMDLFLEFFNAIMPFFEEYRRGRLDKMNKYDAARAGSAL